MSAKQNQALVQSVERCMDILHVIASAGEAMGVSSLARELGVSKSATHRLCRTLAGGRFLSQDERTGRYTPGRRLFQITQNLLATVAVGRGVAARAGGHGWGMLSERVCRRT